MRSVASAGRPQEPECAAGHHANPPSLLWDNEDQVAAGPASGVLLHRRFGLRNVAPDLDVGALSRLHGYVLSRYGSAGRRFDGVQAGLDGEAGHSVDRLSVSV